MRGRRKAARENDLTRRFLTGELDEDRQPQQQRFSSRSKHAQQRKIERTVAMRAEESAEAADIATLPVGQVVQVYSLFSEVAHAGRMYLCVMRKTLAKVSETGIVVGDLVRFRPGGTFVEDGREEAVIEALLPRRTVLTRTDSFHSHEQSPIVANADQMLIVVSLLQPRVKWGLVDRMLVAARSGGLEPVVCLNKVDLAGESSEEEADEGRGGDGDKQDRAVIRARQAMKHYEAMGLRALRTSVVAGRGIEKLKDVLGGRVTVLAGHSGVGKSSLVRAVQPSLDIRIGQVSAVTEKGRHTTTSARRYVLEIGGAVIDTPGVKRFGLWGVTRENLLDYFPDVAEGGAPPWRVESYQRIARDLPED